MIWRIVFSSSLFSHVTYRIFLEAPTIEAAIIQFKQQHPRNKVVSIAFEAASMEAMDYG